MQRSLGHLIERVRRAESVICVQCDRLMDTKQGQFLEALIMQASVKFLQSLKLRVLNSAQPFMSAPRPISVTLLQCSKFTECREASSERETRDESVMLQQFVRLISSRYLHPSTIAATPLSVILQHWTLMRRSWEHPSPMLIRLRSVIFIQLVRSIDVNVGHRRQRDIIPKSVIVPDRVRSIDRRFLHPAAIVNNPRSPIFIQLVRLIDRSDGIFIPIRLDWQVERSL